VNTTLKISSCLGIFLLLGACSLEAKKGPSLLLRFDPQSEARESLAPMSWFQGGPGVRVAPYIDDFQCIGVNVTGPGIADSSISNPDGPLKTQTISQAMAAGSSCSYRGVLGGLTMRPASGVYSPIDVSMSVPAGPGRMVQVFGVNSNGNANLNSKATAMCNTALQYDDGANSGSSSVIYELARAPLPSLFSSRSITLSSNLTEAAWSNPSSKVMDCGDNCAIASANSTITLDTDSAFGSAETTIKLAIPFVIPAGFNSASSTASFKVKLSANGGMSSNVAFSIYSNGSGAPGTLASAVANSTVASNANAAWSYATWSSLALIAGQTYWVVIEPDSAGVTLPSDSGQTSIGVKKYIPSTWSILGGTPDFEISLCPQ